MLPVILQLQIEQFPLVRPLHSEIGNCDFSSLPDFGYSKVFNMYLFSLETQNVHKQKNCYGLQTLNFPTSTPNTPYSKLFKSGFQNWKFSLVAKHTCSLRAPQVAYRIQANKEEYKEYTLTFECSPSIVIHNCFAIRLKTEKIKKVLCRKSRRLWSRGNRWCDLNHRGCRC
jgi:hypothetical protein